MPNEKAPASGRHIDDHGNDGIPYKVRDRDSWKSLAARCKVPPDWLVYYNFQTNNSKEVNWLLREVVGCNVHTPDGHNWMFSKSAKPGIIYLPFQKAPYPCPVTKDFVPKGGQGYRLQTGDCWTSLTKKYHVPDPKILMEFNFGTSNPLEVNWYLQWKVGCKKSVDDGTTWMFTSDADPGIIWFPDWVKGLPPFSSIDI